MDVSLTGGTGSSGFLAAGQSGSALSDSLRNAATAARQLNNLDLADREFSVVRDPASQRFVVRVVERSTGTVLDQFPAESVLRLLTELSPANSSGSGAPSSGGSAETTG